MSNQIAGLRLTGTVTGTGNISLTSIVPNVGSIAASNLTVGQSGWAIIQAGSGATFKREITYVTYTANTPGAGIMSRGECKYSTSSNAKINFSTDTTVIVEFDVPDINIPHKLGPTGTWHLLDELRSALDDIDPTALSDGDVTPDVSGGHHFKTANTSPTTITNFDGSENGKVFELHFEDDNTTIEHGSNIKLPFGVDFVGKQYDMLQCRLVGSVWRCK